jgi:hypothetical protein
VVLPQRALALRREEAKDPSFAGFFSDFGGFSADFWMISWRFWMSFYGFLMKLDVFFG